MAKEKQFEKILEVLIEAAPNAVSKEVLCKTPGVEAARISTYIWEIKKKAGIPVVAIKEGRRVTGFSVPVFSITDADSDTETVSEDTTPTATE